MTKANGLQQRRCGVLLPVTALPDNPTPAMANGGNFDSACRFIDWLANAGASLWQLLPMGIPHADRSPYLCLSAQAGDPDLIGLTWLQEKLWEKGLAPAGKNFSGAMGPTDSHALRRVHLTAAYQLFKESTNTTWRKEYDAFLQANQHWLEDFALFMALRKPQGDNTWINWETPLRDRAPSALAQAKAQLADEIARVQFNQFLFFSQWREIRAHARRRGVLLFGDMPLFVAHDSADIWANRHYFQLAEDGHATVVAGVPPDYFSDIGQYWGNPHYQWQALQADGFAWWISRLRIQLELYDQVRLDHFRGLQAAWEIPADSATAEQGAWREAPGAALLDALRQALGELPLVAEDLGLITEPVVALRKQFNLPGMAVLQFAFNGGADNPYLPHNLDSNKVLYTGTHDNDTSLGWFNAQSDEQREQITRYLRCTAEDMPDALVASALASVARWSVIPLQDLLGLGAGNRINTPGTISKDNWRWRFQWEQITPRITANLRRLNEMYGRV